RGGVGDVRLAVVEIAVDLGLKRRLDAIRGAADRDPGAAAGSGRHGKAFAFEPRANRREVGVAEAEALRVLLGRQPAAVFGRARGLLGREQRGEGRLLLGGGRDSRGDIRNREGRGDFSLVLGYRDAGVDLAGHYDPPSAPGIRANPVLLSLKKRAAG